ncbi:hypothetical protein AB0L71_22380 [Streptomyces sp. NPDC052052]
MDERSWRWTEPLLKMGGWWREHRNALALMLIEIAVATVVARLVAGI